MRTIKKLAFILMLVACGSVASAALVHESTFDSPAQTDPVTAGDVSAIWALSGQWTGGIFGHYDYNGAGQLVLTHPNQAYDHPTMSYDASAALPAAQDMEVVFDCKPKFTAAGTDQGFVFAVAPAAYFDGSTTTSLDVCFMVRSFRGVVGIKFTDADTKNGTVVPFETNNFIPLDVTAAQLNSLRLIVNYNEATKTFRGLYSVNDGPLMQGSSKPIVKQRTASAFHLLTKQTWCWFDLSLEAFDTQADDLKIYDAIQTTDLGEPCPVRGASFNNPAGDFSADYYYVRNVGDVDGVYQGIATTYSYDGQGLFMAAQPAGTNVNTNLKISTITTAAQSAQIEIDAVPNFTADGDGQSFHVKFGSNSDSVFMFNWTAGGYGVWLYYNVADFLHLQDSEGLQLPVAAQDLKKLRYIWTYDAALQESHFYYSINDGSVVEHPNSPIKGRARTAIETEFQWQCWNANSPSVWSVGIDNYTEYDQVLRTGADPNAVGASWMLY